MIYTRHYFPGVNQHKVTDEEPEQLSEEVL